MAKDIEKRVIIIALIIVIVLSALGTWTILEASTGTGGIYKIYENPVATAKVKIGIVPRPEETEGTEGGNGG